MRRNSDNIRHGDLESLSFDLAAELYRQMTGSPFVEALEAEPQMGFQRPGVRESWIGIQRKRISAAVDCELHSGDAWISIWVPSDLRRQGIGSRALAQTYEWAKRHGAAKVAELWIQRTPPVWRY